MVRAGGGWGAQTPRISPNSGRGVKAHGYQAPMGRMSLASVMPKAEGCSSAAHPPPAGVSPQPYTLYSPCPLPSALPSPPLSEDDDFPPDAPALEVSDSDSDENLSPGGSLDLDSGRHAIPAYSAPLPPPPSARRKGTAPPAWPLNRAPLPLLPTCLPFACPVPGHGSAHPLTCGHGPSASAPCPSTGAHKPQASLCPACGHDPS